MSLEGKLYWQEKETMSMTMDVLDASEKQRVNKHLQMKGFAVLCY